MIKKAWNNVVKFVKHLFAKKATSVEVLELTKRVADLELVNQQRFEMWEAKQKKYKNNKKKDKLPY